MGKTSQEDDSLGTVVSMKLCRCRSANSSLVSLRKCTSPVDFSVCRSCK